jgi:hypothetical protein
MKAKIFEIVLHKLASGKSPAGLLEEQLNAFLAARPQIQLAASHVSTLVSPAEPNAMPKSEEASTVIFCTLFYTDWRTQSAGANPGQELARIGEAPHGSPHNTPMRLPGLFSWNENECRCEDDPGIAG